MSIDGEWGDYIVLLGLVNMLDIPVAVVSSLGEEGLNIIYPTVSHGEEDADFDSIASLGHEAESHFHNLQQMDKEAAKKPEVVKELKLKYGEGRITKMKYVQNAGRNFSVIPMVYSRARMAFCRSMPKTVYFVTTT